VWADIVCPFCCLGEQRLADAVAQSPHAADIELKIHTFPLDPGATEVVPVRDYRTKRFGGSAGQILAMEENMGHPGRRDPRRAGERPLCGRYAGRPRDGLAAGGHRSAVHRAGRAARGAGRGERRPVRGGDCAGLEQVNG
jgi:DSBA-like thioredoxin domain-containing protein